MIGGAWRCMRYHEYSWCTELWGILDLGAHVYCTSTPWCILKDGLVFKMGVRQSAAVSKMWARGGGEGGGGGGGGKFIQS